jgi:hypothetical protein
MVERPGPVLVLDESRHGHVSPSKHFGTFSAWQQ